MDLERFLFSLRARGVAPGLEPTRAVLDTLGAPDRAFAVLQIAGTVGKGSTAAFAASILGRLGLRTGLFTSPHLVHFRERFAVDGLAVDDEAIERSVERIRAAAPWAADPACPAPAGLRPLTFFEWCTVLACELFARRGVEVAVLEVGLGGRWDATTAAHADVVAISRIGLDHMATLGDTLEAIAAEKAAAIRPGRPVVIGGQTGEARRVIQARALEVGAPSARLGKDFDLREEAGGLRFASAGLEVGGLALGLPGMHQRENAALAVAAVEALSLAPPGALAGAVRAGLAGARWPGRLERAAPGLWLDGAHNAEGCRALARAIPAVLGAEAVHLLFATLSDRDPLALLEPLLPWAATLTLTRAGGDRALDPEAFAARVRALHPRVEVVADPAAALAAALAAARAKGAPVLACGSLYLVGALRAHLEGAVPEPGDPPLPPHSP